jgi:hypothetical protein
MSTYTIHPDSYGNPLRVDIHRDGRYAGNCPADRAEEFIKESQESTTRHFQSIFDRRFDPRSVIANGTAYWVGSANDYPKGFGGQRWRITWLDGRSIVIDSLWHGGPIPDEWRERLPDNAILQALP